MSVIEIILYTVVVIVALLLIGLVLIQQSKGGGFGSAFGGAGESVFGAHATSHLTKATIILTTIFFILTLALAVITGHKGKSKSSIEIEKDLVSTPTEENADAIPGVDIKKLNKALQQEKESGAASGKISDLEKGKTEPEQKNP